MTKVRTTIVLPEEDLRLVKIHAARLGTTMSELIQEGIKMRLGTKSKKTSRATRVFGSVSRPKGFKGIYSRRSDIYEERLKKQLPSYRQ